MITKKTRALIAAGTGAVILFGGGATYALWQDSETLTPNQFTTGKFELTVKEGDWRDVSAKGKQNGGTNVGAAGVALSTADIAKFLLVPGDTLVGTYDVGVTLAGTNLDAVLDIPGLDDGEIGELITVKAEGLGNAIDGSTLVKITITFAEGDGGHLFDTGIGVPLGNGNLVLSQVR